MRKAASSSSQKTIAVSTTTKEAIRAWASRTSQDPETATSINLEYQSPPITRIGIRVKSLINCKNLSLACNMIEKPLMPANLKNLRVLNLSRNNLRTLIGIQALGKTLEELWVSYNLITSLRPIEAMTALKVFYVSHNNIRDWGEVKHLAVLPSLQELSFSGNPLHQSCGDERFRREIARRLPNIKKVDFVPIIKN